MAAGSALCGTPARHYRGTGWVLGRGIICSRAMVHPGTARSSVWSIVSGAWTSSIRADVSTIRVFGKAPR
jgi:hypothetical protein